MKPNAILYRYIIREMLPPFLLNVIFLTFIFLLSRILEITNLIVNYKIGLAPVFRMIIYTMPYFLAYVIPMSVMLAVLLTFLRMSGDNEITALKASGVSLYQMLPPVLTFCLAGCLLTAFMSVYGLPWGRLALKELTFKVIVSNVDIGLKEREFNNSFKRVMLYINKVDIKTRTLIDVFIEDYRSKDHSITVVAPRGRIFSDPEKTAFRLSLYNGAINQVDLKSKSVNTVRFETYDINLNLRESVTGDIEGPKDEKEMTLAELRQYLEEVPEKDDRYYTTLMEFHKKFSIPFACIPMGLLAIPLGVRSRIARRSYGLALGLIFFLFYYLLLSVGLVFGETGQYPPIIGMWVPNLVIGCLGVYLFYRTAKDDPVQLDIVDRIVRRFGRIATEG